MFARRYFPAVGATVAAQLRRLCVASVRVVSALMGEPSARPTLHMTRTQHKAALTGDIDSTCC
jgi:hypothetical protein